MGNPLIGPRYQLFSAKQLASSTSLANTLASGVLAAKADRALALLETSLVVAREARELEMLLQGYREAQSPESRQRYLNQAIRWMHKHGSEIEGALEQMRWRFARRIDRFANTGSLAEQVSMILALSPPTNDSPQAAVFAVRGGGSQPKVRRSQPTQGIRPDSPSVPSLSLAERVAIVSDPDLFRDLLKECLQKLPRLTAKQKLKLAMAIEARLGDPDRFIRRVAVKALGEMIPHLKEGRERLDRALAIAARLADPSDGIKQAALTGLAAVTSGIAVLEKSDVLILARIIVQGLGDSNRRVRTYAVWGLEVVLPYLTESGCLDIARIILPRLSDLQESTAKTRETSVRALGAMIRFLLNEDEKLHIAQTIEKRLGDSNRDVQRAAAKTLGANIHFLEEPNCLTLAKVIERRLQHPDSFVREAAVELLAQITLSLNERDRLAGAVAIEARLGDQSESVRWRAVSALGEVTPHLKEDDRLARARAIEQKLQDPDKYVRSSAVRALGEIIPSLKEADRSKS